MKRLVYDYSKPLEANQALVHLLAVGTRADVEEISIEIDRSSKKYGYTYSNISGDDSFIAHVDPATKIRLLIIVSDEPFSEEIASAALKYLELYTCVSIVFEYASEAHMLQHEALVEKFKKLSHDRINFLRPVATPSGTLVVPKDKIVDNSICDSVRIKYKALTESTEAVLLTKQVEEFFMKSSEIFRQEHLFHRSPSDGYFAVRVGDSNSFYVTATKTYKDHLSLQRITLVKDYNAEFNELRYEGAFLPSSDAVEAALIFQKLPKVQTILHTHASKQFTRNPNYRHKVTVPIAPYGEASTGILIVEALKNSQDGFIIMEDHGEVFAGYEQNIISSALIKHIELYQGNLNFSEVIEPLILQANA